MNEKTVAIVSVVMWAFGIILLLGAALDAVPLQDNHAIFLALVFFILGAAVRRIGKGCCGK